MNYNELSKQAHEDAKANGWYDTIEPINNYLVLIKSELYEALDAFRSKKYTTMHGYLLNTLLQDLKETGHLRSTQANFKHHIKDTFEDEIADTAIRIFDFCGWYGIELSKATKIQTKPRGQYPSDLIAIDKYITRLFDTVDKDSLSLVLSVILGMLESIAEVYEFDLEQHIVLKMAYNKTRGHKHGGKVF